jgi:hypothetical protein
MQFQATEGRVSDIFVNLLLYVAKRDGRTLAESNTAFGGSTILGVEEAPQARILPRNQADKFRAIQMLTGGKID